MKRVHRVHHEFRPQLPRSRYAHPVEMVLGNFGTWLLVSSSFPTSRPSTYTVLAT